MPSGTRSVKPRTINANEIKIKKRLASRGLSVSGWVEEKGMDKSKQKIVSDVLHGRLTGSRNTSLKNGGGVRAIMVGLHDDFDVTWPWIDDSTPNEIEEFRKLFRGMCAHQIPKRRGHLLNPLPLIKAASDIDKLNIIKKEAMTLKNPEARARWAKRLFQGCKVVSLCPVCFGNAENDRNHNGREALLICKNGCNGGQPIAKANVADVIGCS